MFDRWNNATYTNTTFTGLEGVEGLDDIEVKTCYMALNNPHANDVTYDHCTFREHAQLGNAGCRRRAHGDRLHL